MKPKKMSKATIQATLSGAITDAVGFIESEIAQDRITAQRYFDGKCRIKAEEGRSQIVATKVRDTIRAVKPALMRLFLQSKKPVEFIPTSPQAAAGAEQATSYARYVFDKNGGFMALYDVIHDALVKKTGVVKVYYDDAPCVEIDEYSALPVEAAAMILSDASDDTELLEQQLDEETGLLSMKIARTSRRGEIKFHSVAPEDFFVDRDATSIKDCYVCGHSTEGRVGDLVRMGFDFDEVFDLGGDAQSRVQDEETLARTGWDENTEDEDANDPSMRKVLITEAYMKMDIEGTGVPRLYKFICGGGSYKVLDYELCDHLPFAVFEVDPEPHTFFGRSLAEIVVPDQDAATVMLRGILDGMAFANNPRMEVVETNVNMEDVLNTEIGGVVRVKQPGMLREINMGLNTTAVLPIVQYYDEQIKVKTGVVGAGMGLDVEALQSQTAAGVRLAEQTTAAVSELIARVLAEGGLRHLFEIIAQLARQHPDQNAMMRIDGDFVPVDPRSWSTEMDLIANVGLGTNRNEERLMVMSSIAQFQQQVWQGYGPQNGLVTLTGIRNLQADIAKMAGVYNVDRYLNPMTPEAEQQILQQAAQAAQEQQQQADPSQAYLQAEQMKVQARMQADQQRAQLDAEKAQAEFAFRAQENAQKDDLQRDKMVQDLILRVAELEARYGARVPTGSVIAEQDAPRG